MNSYALGRIVAGEEVAARFISARKSHQNIDVHCAFRGRLQSPHMWSCDGLASVAGFGVSGPFGPRDGISSGMRPGNSSGRGDSPGSRTGGAISGCGLPGGIPAGGSVGVPGVVGGMSGGSIGMGIIDLSCPENNNDDAASMFLVRGVSQPVYSGVWQTASML
ncbi:hypothetical protein IVB18_48575 [Bradyrhizobium sp. 186]|nr:hypothetical protein IVB18_48575 [Bradyrhizobium sp. 186]